MSCDMKHSVAVAVVTYCTPLVQGKGTMLTWWLLGRENSATSPIRKASIPSQSISRPGTSSSTKSSLKPKPTRTGTKMSLPGAVEE